MQKLRIKKGFTIIEVLCSIAIFSIITSAVIDVCWNTVKLRKDTETSEKYALILETAVSNLENSLLYIDVDTLMAQQKRFISKEYLTMDMAFNENFKEHLQPAFPNALPYLELRFQGQDVYRITTVLHYRSKGIEKILCCDFYKGNY